MARTPNSFALSAHRERKQRAAKVYSRSNPGDIDASCKQHAVDALRYGLTRRKVEFIEMRVYGI